MCNKLRVFFIPFLTKGHLIPLTDLACLVAASGKDVEVTVVVTPENASFIRSTLDRAASASYPVQLITYSFPSGSYVDCDFSLTRPAHEEILHQHKPDAVVSDANFWWITAIAADLGITPLTFLITSTFSCLAIQGLRRMGSKIYHQDPVTIPGLPGPQTRIPLSELPEFVFPQENYVGDQMESMFNSEAASFGCIINSVYEFEREYCDHFCKTVANNSYFVGPMFFYDNKHRNDALTGNGDAAYLSWLDTKENSSVVFASFGGHGSLKAAQIHELALGLEACKKNFVWVVTVDQAEGLPEGWEERVADRGLLVKGWSPQLAILRHPAVGAFLSHCGWNSCMEGITSGLPILTWPLAYEQFITERLIVDMKGLGARVCESGKRSTTEQEKELVPREVIAEAVSQFMEPGGIGERARLNARKVATLAEAAVAEGGTSRRDLDRLISDLLEAKQNKQASKPETKKCLV